MSIYRGGLHRVVKITQNENHGSVAGVLWRPSGSVELLSGGLMFADG